MHVLSTAFTSFLLTMLQQVFTFNVIIQCVVFFLLCSSFYWLLLYGVQGPPLCWQTRKEDQSHERMAYLNKKRIVFSLVHFQSDFYGISDVLGARMREHEKLNEENKSKNQAYRYGLIVRKKVFCWDFFSWKRFTTKDFNDILESSFSCIGLRHKQFFLSPKTRHRKKTVLISFSITS